MTTTDQTTTTDARTTILDALAQAGVSPEDAARMVKDVARKTPQHDTRDAQQLGAVQLSRITDKQLKDANVTRETYIEGARQLLGYSSHLIDVPEMFGPRYDANGETLWGRPRPKSKSKSTETETITETE
jgi:hypothetical protein